MTGTARNPFHFRIAVAPARTTSGEDSAFYGEAALIQSVRAGGEGAFRQLVEGYQTKVYSLVSSLLPDPTGADEIAQRVFARIYFNLDRPARLGSLLFWIYEIAVSECFRHLRERQPCDKSEQAMEFGRRARALELLSRIRQRNRTLLILREVEGFSIADLSEMTGLSQREINTRLFRGRQAMAETKRFSFRVALTQLAGRLGIVE